MILEARAWRPSALSKQSEYDDNISLSVKVERKYYGHFFASRVAKSLEAVACLKYQLLSFEWIYNGKEKQGQSQEESIPGPRAFAHPEAKSRIPINEPICISNFIIFSFCTGIVFPSCKRDISLSLVNWLMR